MNDWLLGLGVFAVFALMVRFNWLPLYLRRDDDDAIYLTERDWDAMVEALENPPEPNAELKNLLDVIPGPRFTQYGPWVEYTVTETEVMSHPYNYQTVMKLLQEKGAPILGTLYLQVDPQYECYERPIVDSGLTYRFRKILDAKAKS